MCLDKIRARFLRFVQVCPDTGCWIWTGANDARGYGKFWIARASRRAHRVAIRLWRGRWPRRDMVLLHKCDRRACVNPEHLREGFQVTNVRDMIRKGRAAWQTAKTVEQSAAL